MCGYTMIDTFPDFLAFWEKARHLPLDVQVNGWASDYMARWPELLEKQIHSYAEEDTDWRQVAKEHIIPLWEAHLPRMQHAHTLLLQVCPIACERAQKKLGFTQALTLVIYVGMGCGAGWATTYQNSAALLLGLENIAEEGWDNAATLTGLIGHEIGHLWHFSQRARAGLTSKTGPWWMLYTEGMAQRCEHLIAGEESWHMAAQHGDWLRWCTQEKRTLAREFLRVIEEEGDIRVFFGSWFNLYGYQQTGYYLGHEAVRQLETQMSLQDIALMEDIEGVFSVIVRALAAEHP